VTAIITKTAIIEALGELQNYEEGFRFQALGVTLAKSKCPELKASEPKSDLGLDAYAPGELFENGKGRGVACSNSATLTKIREDILEAQKHFQDLGILFFATPKPVSETKAKGWKEKVKKDYGITLIVISREEVINELLKSENLSLCSSILRIPTTVEPSLEQVLSDCGTAITEINTWWTPQIPNAHLISLSADELGNRGNPTGVVLELEDLQEMLTQGRRVVLEAPAGRGKTTTLSQLAGRFSTANSLTFIVDLPSWTQTGNNILVFIAGMHPFKARGVDAGQLAKLYNERHFIFLLNGWNEIAETESHRAQLALAALEREYPKAGILVATRTHRIKPPLPGTTVRAKLRILNQRQRANYVAARLGKASGQVLNRIHAEPVLDELTRTPLFLAEVVSIAEAGREIPVTKMGVLREVVHLPEANPTHAGPLENQPLSGHADVYLTSLASTMTATSLTQISELEAKRVANERLRQFRDAGEASAATTVIQILSSLADHHVLERMDYPSVSFRFEHQQMQEYYAAEFVKQVLCDLVTSTGQNASFDVLLGSDLAKNFQIRYINQSSWSEPLYMVAGDSDAVSLEDAVRPQLVEAKALLVLLALDVDVIFAAEIFRVCSRNVQVLVEEKLVSTLQHGWSSSDGSVRSQALSAMIASGSERFKAEMIPIMRGASDHSNFEVYRSSNPVRLSALGKEWQQEVRGWDEESRLAFISELFHAGDSVEEVAQFALTDPSVKVRSRAFSDLMWIDTTDETTQLMMRLDDAAFEEAIDGEPARYIHHIFQPRALQSYQRTLTNSDDLTKRLIAAGNTVLMGQPEAHQVLRECLDQATNEHIHQMEQRDLKELLDALGSDPTWRSGWVISRVLEGSLSSERWKIFVNPIDGELKEKLLSRLESEDLTKNHVAGIQGLLRLNAAPDVAQRVFLRIVELNQRLGESISVRSEENLQRARELGDLKRQLQDFLRKLDAQTMVDGILLALSADFTLTELEALAELWDWGMDNEADLRENLDASSLAAVRTYLTEAVAQLSNENDPSGQVRAHLSVAISRVGEAEDITYVAALLESEISRIRAAKLARESREKSRIANGSQMRYTNRYLLAVRQLQSESEGFYLAKFLGVPEYEGDVAWSLVEWALARSLPSTTLMNGWANRSRRFQEIWEARAANGVSRFDEERRVAATTFLLDHINALRSGLAADTPDAQTVWRLKDLMRPLATLDGKASAPLILQVVALPLKTHGTMDGWKRLQSLEVLLFEGAVLPNEQTLAIAMPVVEELNSKWHSDNETSLYTISFCIMPYLQDPVAGVAVLSEVLGRTRMSFEGIGRVISALGHSRCEQSLDLLLTISTRDDMVQHLGDVWINAVAELNTSAAHEVLLSFVDPGSPHTVSGSKVGREDVLARRIADLSSKNLAIRTRLLGLCHRPLDVTQRKRLGTVIALLGDDESLIESLYLLDDISAPHLPYELSKAIEHAFVEHRPVSEDSNTYTLHPRSANDLRDKIVELAKSDPKRRVSAKALLARIESLRLDYGRPIGETRNPTFV
jgi:hypothetical protein